MELMNHLIITLPMIICLGWAVFFLIRCATRNGEMRVSGILFLFYTITTILYADHWLYFSGIATYAGEWSYRVVNLCVYPVYYAYLRALTRESKSLEVSFLLLPALAMAVLFPFAKHSEEGLIWEGANLFARICFAAQVAWVWYRGYGLLNRTIQRMDDTYSDDRSHLLRPTHILLQLFGITAAVSMVLNIIGREPFADDLSVTLPAIVMTVRLYCLGYVAAHTTLPQETVTEDTAATEEPVQKEDSIALMQKIDRLMREQRLYTNPHLTIQDLAAAANSNRTYISNAINRTYGISFSQYVTRQRIAYAKMVLTDPRYQTDKSAVADAITLSGFASDTTFYRVFKDATGETPLQYRHNNLAKASS